MRLDPGPLLDAVPGPPREKARVFGVTERTVCRWRHRWFTIDEADEYAVAAGLHPAEVWGDDWWAAS